MAPTSLVVSGLLLLTLLPSLVPAQTVTSEENYLIVTNYHNVSVLSMRGEVQHEFSGTYSHGVDFDPTTARIFWTNYNQSTIETAFLNGSQRTVLRQLQPGTNPTGLAVDHILQLVFYSDYNVHRIGVMDTDGGSHRIVRDQGLTRPRALAVDVIHEVLYYTGEIPAGKIGRMNYNGSGHEVLVNISDYAYGLALDVRGGRMYWTTYSGGIMESARLDGTDRTLVLRDPSDPNGLAIFDGVLYYSALSVSYIYTVTVNGTDRQVLTTNVHSGIYGFRDIAVYSESQSITLEEKLAALSGRPSNVPLTPSVSIDVDLRVDGSIQVGTIAFSCDFQLPANASDLRYDVFWYINGQQVVNFSAVAAEDLSGTVLKEEHWKNIGLGMTVTCSARTRFLQSSAAGPHFHSHKFFAGLETDREEITVKEGGSATLRLRSTVPLPHAVLSSGRVLGSMEVYVFTPASGLSSVACQDLTRGGVAFQQNFHCGVELHFSNYTQWVALEVTAVVDNVYTGDRTANLKLGVGQTPFALSGRKLWTNYTMPDVKVRIQERDALMAGKVCQSFDDPHMTSGDGPRWGWENHRVGEFILYRHSQLPLAVHVKYQYCGHVWNGYRVTCNCGVAVQAYNSLVVLDRCSQVPGSSHPLNHVQYLGCDSQQLVISQSGYSYKVTLPTGTAVQFNVYPFYAPGIGSVSVFPSVADLNNTGGLCGLMDGDPNNDFTLRNGAVASSSDDFAEDWRARESESLFVENPSLPSAPSADKTYCTCEASGHGLKPTSTCAMSFPAKRCPQENNKFLSAFLHSCGQSRRGRDLHLSDLVSDGPSGWQPAETPVLRAKRQTSGDQSAAVPDWTGEWNESRARDHCQKAFQQAGGLDVLEQASGLTQVLQRHLDACVLDIKLTGGTSYTEVTVEIYKGIALEAATRNVTLLASEEGRQLMDQVSNHSCPRDCSGHGQCNQGTCQCSPGYVGQDCGIDRSTPPQNPYIPQNGLCDTQNRACQSTPVLADNLPDDGQVFCRFQRILVNGSRVGEVNWRQTTQGQPWLPGQVQCPFPSHRSKRQTSGDVTALGYYVSISNNNVTFSADVTVIIYDSRCFSCHSSNLTCLPTGQCASPSTPSDPGIELTTIVVSVVGGLVFVMVLALVGVLVYKKVCRRRTPVGHLTLPDATPSVPPASFTLSKEGWKE